MPRPTKPASRRLRATLLGGALLAGAAGAHEARNFAIVGKSQDQNFIAAWRGCDDEARRFGDRCELLASARPAHPRLQKRVVEEALLSGRYAAMAISVTHSGMIARAISKASIPVITFDSPFLPADAQAGRSYVGIDNMEFGRALARLAKAARPDGGSVCLMTAEHDPNLSQRLWGVRRELSGNPALAFGARLTGQQGWTESRRCPWSTNDTQERAMLQLTTTLEAIRPDVLLSVGHWPAVDPVAYRKAVSAHRAALTSGKTLSIIALGKATEPQRALLDEHLVHGYASIDFVAIGKQCYEQMKAETEGRARPAGIHPISVEVARAR